MKYLFIKANQASYTVQTLCWALRVSRSGYYSWLNRLPSQREKANQDLLRHIQRVHKQSREHYGIRKVWKQLVSEGITCGKNRIARLRAVHHIYAKRRKRFVVTTRSKSNLWIAPDRLQRDFTAKYPNQKWVSDVTFIPTRTGWLYLAVTLDLYSRRVVGWAMSSRNNGQLVLDCLNMALEHRQPEKGLIHHSDQGATYRMKTFQKRLSENGILSSMSRAGDCYDNAVVESFFGQLKNELTFWQNYKNRETAKRSLFDYIEIFYNRQRIHQTIGYKTPVQFEQCVA